MDVTEFVERLASKELHIRLRPIAADRPGEMEEIVCNRRLWFSGVEYQDDIFEGRPLFSWADPAWTRKSVRALVMSRDRGFRPWEREQVVNRMIARLESPDALAKMKSQIESGLSETYIRSSIASFFRDASVQRNWSDYASRGQGFGVAFDFSVPWHYESAVGLGVTPMVPFPVAYVDPMERPRIELSFRGVDRAAGFEDVEKGLLMKSNEWAGQAEERLFRIGIPAGSVEFPRDSLAGVALGYAASDATIEMAKDVCRRAGVPLVQAKRGNGYLLDFSPVG